MKRNTNAFLLITAFVALCGVPTIAHAQVSGDFVQPNVMLLIDSSGGMDWRYGTPPAGMGEWEWAEQACRAYDAANQTSWQGIQDALLGGIESNYYCSVEPSSLRPMMVGMDPTALSGHLPDYISEFKETTWSHFRAVRCDPADWQQSPTPGFYQCVGPDPLSDVTLQTYNGVYCPVVDSHDGECFNYHPAALPRAGNGVLDRYADSANFGIMTLDNMPNCQGDNCDDHAHLWNYGATRKWECYDEKDCYWNAGVRAERPEAVGGMIGIGLSPDETNNAVRTTLQSMEPIYCSPIASMIDDAGYYFASELNVLPTDGSGSVYGLPGADSYYPCRPKLALLISDGEATEAFEYPAGTCGGSDAVWSPTNLNPGETQFDCPWRSGPEEAAEMYDLVQSIYPDASPIQLIVIGYRVNDIDCTADPDACIVVGDSYVPCHLSVLPAPIPDKDGVMEIRITPRQYLNEMACKAWPDSADVQPPWLNNCDTARYETGTCRSTICCGEERALFANNPTELSAVIDMVLSSHSATLATRTDVVTSNVVGANSIVGTVITEQMEFTSGYVARAGEPWDGILLREDYACDSANNAPATSDLISVGAWLIKQGTSESDRLLFSTPRKSDPSEPLLHEDDYTIGSMADLLDPLSDPDDYIKQLKGSAGDFDDCDLGLDLTYPDGCEGTNIVLSKVSEFMQERGLADIYNSTPDMLEPARERLPLPSYQGFQTSVYGGSTPSERDSFMFSGTNDGVLHAFDVFALDGEIGDTVEAWGYIPRSILRQIKKQFPVPRIEPSGGSGYIMPDELEEGLHQHLFLMDGSPVATDVRLYRDPDATLEQESAAWRSVVFGATGRGARTYYALDVTDALQVDKGVGPTLRWEISPDENMYGNNEVDLTNTDNAATHFRKMGFPVSKPKLAYPILENDDINKKKLETAVAILPGGWKADATKNTGVYIVRLADGKLIKYLEPGAPNTADICKDESNTAITAWGLAPGETAQLIGEPAVPFGTRTLTITTEAFIGDDRGRLWMIEMPSTPRSGDGPPQEDWCLRLYFDTLLAHHYPYQDCTPGKCNLPESSYATDGCLQTDCCTGNTTPQRCVGMEAPRTPILAPPTVAQNENFENVLIFGTGTFDSLSELSRNRVFSITDKTTTNSSDGKVLHDTPELNWWIGDWYYEGSTSPATPDSSLGTERLDVHDEMPAKWVDFDSTEFWGVGEKLVGRATVFDGAAYFSSFSPLAGDGNNACDLGGSKIWGVDFDDRLGRNGVWETEKSLNDFGFHIGQPYSMFQEVPNSLLSSVRVVQRPACFNGGIPLLVAQKANADVDPRSPAAAGTTALVKVEIALPKKTPGGATTIRFDSWAILF